MINHCKIAIIVVAFAGLVASGCTNTTNPQNDVYAAAVALTAADNVAIRYVTLPLCGPAHAKPLCSEAAVSAKIKEAAQTAHDAVKTAEMAANDPVALAAARAAISALVNVTPKPAA